MGDGVKCGWGWVVVGDGDGMWLSMGMGRDVQIYNYLGMLQCYRNLQQVTVLDQGWFVRQTHDQIFFATVLFGPSLWYRQTKKKKKKNNEMDIIV